MLAATKGPRVLKKKTRNITTSRAEGISDAAVRKATGKDRAQWFKILDAFDVKKNGHAAAATHLHDEHACPPWWSQMVVVEYERERGLRVKHQVSDGFSVSASRVMNVPIARLYKAWQGKAVAAWLPDPGFAVRTRTANKSMRITWVDGKTHVEANFYAKGEGKSQVTVQHNKLKTEAAAKKMKKYWGEAMDRLKGLMEA